MATELVFHWEVRQDVQAAFRWYEKQCAGLGDEYLAALEETYDRIRQNPSGYAKVWHEARRAMTRRFPYGVFFRINDKRVEVIAVHHHRRDPELWQSRF
jgi:plasmid stabilization system protein ParE